MLPALLLPHAPATALAAPRFEDASAEIEADIAGLSDGAHGVAWLDADGDGDLDLAHTNGIGFPARLWRNEGGRFVEDTAFPGPTTGTSGVLAADLDGDGATDLLMLGEGALRSPATPPRLLRNPGDGSFFEVGRFTGLEAVLPPVTGGATAADVDGDGDLEVLVVSPGTYPSTYYADVLLFREGDGWVDRAGAWGVDEVNGNCAAAFVHLDDDPWIDLVVGSCNTLPQTLRVYRNVEGRTFERLEPESRLWAQGFWMGFALGDFDDNGLADLLATNAGGDVGYPPALYLQQPDRTFLAGSAPFSLYAWGTTAADFDLDGALDLLQVGSNRAVFPLVEERASPGDLALGLGDGTFAAGDLGVDLFDRLTSGLAAADYDDDGYLDLAVGVTGDLARLQPSAPILLRNTGGDGAWLTVEPHDPDHDNHAAIGARVTAVLPSGRALVRQVLAGTSFASTESPWPHFGLAGHESARVCVRWPDGDREDFGVVTARATFEAVRGDGFPVDACEPGRPGPEAECGCATRGSGAPPWPAALLLAALRRRRGSRRT